MAGVREGPSHRPDIGGVRFSSLGLARNGKSPGRGSRTEALPSRARLVSNLSDIAPADFGLGSVKLMFVEFLNVTSVFLADGGLEVPPLTMDVILPVTEWEARTVDMELEVSEEIVESGRGMNSMVSENPTRGRACPVLGALSRRFNIVGLGSWCERSGGEANPSRMEGRRRCTSGFDGVLGALSDLEFFASPGGLMMADRSWLDMAPDRR